MRPPCGFKLADDLRLTAENSSRLRRRSAHIKGKNVVDPQLAAEKRRADDAGCRATFDDRRRAFRRDVDCCHTAIALHHVERGTNSKFAHFVLELFEVSSHEWDEQRIDDRRAGALVLAILGIDLARKRYLDIRDACANGVSRRTFVRGVGVGVQKRNRNRTHVGTRELGNRRIQRSAIERNDDGTRMIEALAHADAVAARDERTRALHEQVVDFGTILPADLEDVAKTFRRQKRDARQLEIDLPEQRIRRDRARMSDQADRRVRLPRDELAQRTHDGFFRRARRRRNLKTRKHAGHLVKGDEIGKRPADVDADSHPAGYNNVFVCTSISFPV